MRTWAERHPDRAPPAVRWLPFELNPDLPAEGISREEYFIRKWGTAKRDNSRLEGIGRSVGIEFAFDAIKVQPNTLAAHRLMLYGARNSREDEVAEALFEAYFLNGAVLTDISVLADIGASAGLEREPLERYLRSDEDRETVVRAEEQSRRIGVNGVPFFIFNRKIGVSGAHEPDTLLEAMEQAVTE